LYQVGKEAIFFGAYLQLELFRAILLLFTLCAAALLAAFGYSGHILVYALRDILTCRLAATQIVLSIILWLQDKNIFRFYDSLSFFCLTSALK